MAEQEKDEEGEDILLLVKAEAAKTEQKKYRFESVDTRAINNCFITTVLENPTILALKILQDAPGTKKLIFCS